MLFRHVLFATASVLCLCAPAYAFDPVVATPPATATAAPAAPANPNAPVTRGELSALMREALLKDPEMLTDAIKVMHDKQQETAQQESKEALGKYQDELFKDTTSPYIGAKDADVTFVEFFDYHCGYCKHLLPTLAKLTQSDKKVRVIFREFPILSEDSVLASRAALAVNRVAPAKYFEYHSELMKSSKKFDQKGLTELAVKLGVDGKKFQAAFEDKETTDMLDKNRELADKLGIRGTPALAFPDKILPGALPYEDLVSLIEDQRAAKK